mmetsp:Transcript_264/g.703  ORF Transcript_264/g.703 Transcript_264/m.703 type:complete len:345 (+) Transcript_264:457-1491(+)
MGSGGAPSSAPSKLATRMKSPSALALVTAATRRPSAPRRVIAAARSVMTLSRSLSDSSPPAAACSALVRTLRPCSRSQRSSSRRTSSMRAAERRPACAAAFHSAPNMALLGPTAPVPPTSASTTPTARSHCPAWRQAATAAPYVAASGRGPSRCMAVTTRMARSTCPSQAYAASSALCASGSSSVASLAERPEADTISARNCRTRASAACARRQSDAAGLALRAPPPSVLTPDGGLCAQAPTYAEHTAALGTIGASRIHRSTSLARAGSPAAPHTLMSAEQTKQFGRTPRACISAKASKARVTSVLSPALPAPSAPAPSLLISAPAAPAPPPLLLLRYAPMSAE